MILYLVQHTPGNYGESAAIYGESAAKARYSDARVSLARESCMDHMDTRARLLRVRTSRAFATPARITGHVIISIY